MSSLDELSADIDHTSTSVSKSDSPQGVQFYEHLVKEYGAISIDLELYRTKADIYLNSLARAVSNKKERPFESIPMDNVMKETPDSAVLGRLNGIIQKHNKVCENHAANAIDARKQLECGVIVEGLDPFRKMSASVKVHDTSIASIESRAKDLRTKISGLEVEITEHGGPAEELNDDLHKYVGHRELQLEVRDNSYTVTRDGIAASQLSEGEITAIALLYFLKSLTDHRFDFPNGAVVLDDPISSLDANSLFLAYGFIQERTKDAGQLFILTHNFAFFRQVRNWFHHIKGQRGKNVSKRPARFYMLDCLSDDKGRYSNIQHLDRCSNSTNLITTTYSPVFKEARLLRHPPWKPIICSPIWQGGYWKRSWRFANPTFLENCRKRCSLLISMKSRNHRYYVLFTLTLTTTQ